MQIPASHIDIPDHQVIRKIGSGAYGEVWLARTITGAWRAIKIVRRKDFEDERTFQREFEGIRHYEPIARNHSGLVHILHVGNGGEGENQYYYYVMELGDDVDNGSDIHPADYTARTLQTDKKLAAGRPMPVRYTLEIGIQLADALAYLHSQGLTHRDIKPANIIFVKKHPKLADVGLVAQFDQHTFVGTEGFIPREGPGSQRADVYALGKVLYEISSGKDRLDFPELPSEFPENFDNSRWLPLNKVICETCEHDLNRCSIQTAKDLSLALKRIKAGKDYNPKATYKRLLIYTSIILMSFTLASFFLYFFYNDKINSSHEGNTVQPVSTGTLHIQSTPHDASIYDKEGNYIDKTPYSTNYPAGTEVSFVIKKKGYKDLVESGVVKANQTLGIGGVLIPFTPPVKGEPWTDINGQKYTDNGKKHISESPIDLNLYNAYQEQFPKRKPLTANENNLNNYALLTQREAQNYARWLTEKCIEEGLLTKDQIISAIPIEEWKDWKLSDDDKKQRRSAYLTTAGDIHYTTVEFSSTPSQADIFVNGINIGKTPTVFSKLEPGKYTFTIKKDGHAKYEITGNVDEENKNPLFVQATLTPDQSVIFNTQWINSLGMRFKPITSYLSASEYETRVGDYEAYLEDQGLTPLQGPKFGQDVAHPVVNITKGEAMLFADWLTRKEQKAGLISHSDFYRLPTDEEWTLMAGDFIEEGKTPNERHTSSLSPELNKLNAPDLFPWGNSWPPPAKSGNFSDKSKMALPTPNDATELDYIPQYNDSFINTAPVGKFLPNKKKLYDISGNVWEWVEDPFGGTPDFKFKDYEVARGGGWSTYKPFQLLTRYRLYLPPNTRSEDIGFRLVLVRQTDILSGSQINEGEEIEGVIEDSSNKALPNNEDMGINSAEPSEDFTEEVTDLPES